jgi:hypothetical protein
MRNQAPESGRFKFCSGFVVNGHGGALVIPPGTAQGISKGIIDW